MQHIQATDRKQHEFSCLDELVGDDNTVRFIEALVEKLDLPLLGFAVKNSKNVGRPSFDTKVYLKLYLYGYLNGIRSSRRLEKECTRNIELQWLLGRLVPNYHSIADFRKDNPSALRNTFKLLVLFLKDAELVSGTTVAVDGTKMRAHNSKKNNFNPKKLERHLKYIEDKTNEYLSDIEKNDTAENSEKVTGISDKIERLKKNRIKYELLLSSLNDGGETQVSTTDKDARALLVQGQVVEVSYNMQAAVDDKYKLVVATHTINRNDRNALSDIAKEAKSNLEVNELTVLSDKGYHNGRELLMCSDNSIITICAPPELVNSNDKGTTPEYMAERFIYNKANDTYTCPVGSTLYTKGTWHVKTKENSTYKFKKYRTPDCSSCPVKHLCTGRVKGGREIERSVYSDTVEQNKVRYQQNKELYRKRQEINEHIFGTIKRKWGYNHTNLKGLEKVNGEFALIMTVYNLKRCMNILGINELIEKVKKWKPDYKRIVFTIKNWASNHHITAHLVIEQKFAA